MKGKQFSHLVLALGILTLTPFSSEAQLFKKKNKKSAKTEESSARKQNGKSIKEVTKNAVQIDGLFNMYRDTVTGESWIEIPEEALSKEYIYFAQVEDGVLQTGNFRGSYRDNKVISFEKNYEKLEIIQENINYYYDPESPLSKVQDANINRPILASLKILAKDSASYLVSADAIFLSEKISMIKPPARPGSKSALGKLSKDKSKVTHINNYPENLEVVVDFVYDNPNPQVWAEALTDSRYITVAYRHAFLEMPDDGFTPRRDDQRIGYFMTKVNDMTSASSTPWRDVIHRWRLEKKDPNAELSEPVKPITWWIENTTPYEFRDHIKNAVEMWNLAFEKVGFKNAVVVKIQPDDAEWDAGDIRYNVLRWTSSPTTPFSGYGPSFVNPRTGEILGADVMLEFAGMAGRVWRSGIYKDGEMEMEEMDARARTAEMLHRCDAGAKTAHNTLFSLAAMKVMDFNDEENAEFTRQTLHRLALHEVGHTLGFSHNMHASTMLTPDELKDPSVVAVNGMCNTVMEYPSINFARNKEDQTLFYDDSPGPYDYWLVEYGYSEGLDDPAAEEARLEAILSKSTSPLLQFGNDADDMRSPGRGINPDVNIYDLSSDPVAYASERCDLINDLLPEITSKYSEGAESYHEVNRTFKTLVTEYYIQAGIMSRQIGGVRYNRATPEQLGNEKPFTPVSKADQIKAMDALSKYVFGRHAFDAFESCYAYLHNQRRGWSYYGAGEDPDIHGYIMRIQRNALVHLLHPNVLARITNSSLYGNDYDVAEYMIDLTNAIFEADYNKSVNTYRQRLQIKYVEALIAGLNPKKGYDSTARGIFISELKRIDLLQKAGRSPNDLTKAHRAQIRHLIDLGFEK